MIYIRPSAHKKLKNDIAKFIQGANAARPSSTSQQGGRREGLDGWDGGTGGMGAGWAGRG